MTTHSTTTAPPPSSSTIHAHQQLFTATAGAGACRSINGTPMPLPMIAPFSAQQIITKDSDSNSTACSPPLQQHQHQHQLLTPDSEQGGGSSLSQVSTLDQQQQPSAPSPPAQQEGYSGYTAVRDDDDQDIYALFFSSSLGAQAAEIQQPPQIQPPQPQEQPQSQQGQEQPTPQPSAQQGHPSPIVSSAKQSLNTTTGGGAISATSFSFMVNQTQAAMAALTSPPTVPLVMPPAMPGGPMPPLAMSLHTHQQQQPMSAPPGLPMPSVVSPELPLLQQQIMHQNGSTAQTAQAQAQAQAQAHQQTSSPQLQPQQLQPQPQPLQWPRGLAPLVPSSANQDARAQVQQSQLQALQDHLNRQQQQASSQLLPNQQLAANQAAVQPPQQQAQAQVQQQAAQQSQLQALQDHLNRQQQQQAPSPQLQQPSSAQVDADQMVAAMSRRNFAPKKRIKNKANAAAYMYFNTVGAKKRGSPSSYSPSPSASAEAWASASKSRPAKLSRSMAMVSSSPPPSESPQAYLLSILSSRSYPKSIHKSSSCGYKTTTPPNPLQLASYGTAVLRSVQSRDAPALRSLLESGLSPNPCNRFSESILDMSAKRGSAEVFGVQLDAGADVQVADDFGRTPLHHVAWGSSASSKDSGCFEIVTRILEQDPDMVRVSDDRGKAPMEYVRESEWGRWIEYLEKNKDRFWPVRDQQAQQQASTLDDAPRPKKRPAGARVSDPPNALSPEVAKLVADGKVKPEDAGSISADNLPQVVQEAQQGFKFPSMLASIQGGR